MSTLHHESLYETCYEEAIESFCKSNNLTAPMFALIENHLGVQYTLEKKANELFEDKCY